MFQHGRRARRGPEVRHAHKRPTSDAQRRREPRAGSVFLFHSVMPDALSSNVLRRQLLEYCLKRVPQDATPELDVPELERRRPAPPDAVPRRRRSRAGWSRRLLRIRRRGYRCCHSTCRRYKIDWSSAARTAASSRVQRREVERSGRYDADMSVSANSSAAAGAYGASAAARLTATPTRRWSRCGSCWRTGHRAGAGQTAATRSTRRKRTRRERTKKTPRAARQGGVTWLMFPSPVLRERVRERVLSHDALRSDAKEPHPDLSRSTGRGRQMETRGKLLSPHPHSAASGPPARA